MTTQMSRGDSAYFPPWTLILYEHGGLFEYHKRGFILTYLILTFIPSFIRYKVC